jgi:hypothetical protein
MGFETISHNFNDNSPAAQEKNPRGLKNIAIASAQGNTSAKSSHHQTPLEQLNLYID